MAGAISYADSVSSATVARPPPVDAVDGTRPADGAELEQPHHCASMRVTRPPPRRM
jgi:hypothetical protein